MNTKTKKWKFLYNQDISKLKLQPVDIEPETGELIGEEPIIKFFLNEDETKTFKTFIKNTGQILESLKIRQNNWEFLEIALGFFVKAFFSDEDMEQMLWHITTLEALLGEKGEGLTEKLAQRIASILGKNDKERKDIKRQFKEIYNIRCELVHGRTFSKQVYMNHLRIARNLSRQLLIWFINYLHYIQAKISKEQAIKKIPQREDILALIDMNPDSRFRLFQLIDNLPTSFPNVKEWIEQSKL